MSFAAVFVYTTCMPSWPDIPTPVSATWIILTSLAPSPTEKRKEEKTKTNLFYLECKLEAALPAISSPWRWQEKTNIQEHQRVQRKNIFMASSAAYEKSYRKQD